MDKTTREILRRILAAPIVYDNPLDDPPPPEAMDLVGRGLLRKEVDRNNAELFTIVVSQTGREALEACTFRGRARRVGAWLLARVDTLVMAFATAVVTAWVTAHFTAAHEVSRRMPDGVPCDLRGEPERSGDRNRDDGQPLAATHYTNAVPVPSAQQRVAE